MKLSVAREALLAAACRPSPASRRPAAPYRRSPAFCRGREDAGVELRATDMESGCVCRSRREVERAGRGRPAGAPAARRGPLAAGGDLTLELRAERAGRRARRPAAATFHLRTLRAEDFPPLPEPPAESTVVTVPAAAFVETIARVSRSASRDETRPILTGILVSAAGDELRMVATDSYRLSVKETQLEQPLEGGFEANVPARALEELARIAQPRAPSRSRIGVRTNQVVFEVGRRGPLLAPHRRPVPELPPAAARDVRARAARDRAELLEVVRRDQPAGAEERAAAPELHRGRADRLGADARRGRGQRVAARTVRGRAVRDRLQPGVPRATASRASSSERARPQAHQPAAPRA